MTKAFRFRKKAASRAVSTDDIATIYDLVIRFQEAQLPIGKQLAVEQIARQINKGRIKSKTRRTKLGSVKIMVVEEEDPGFIPGSPEGRRYRAKKAAIELFGISGWAAENEDGDCQVGERRSGEFVVWASASTYEEALTIAKNKIIARFPRAKP